VNHEEHEEHEEASEFVLSFVFLVSFVVQSFSWFKL